MLRIWIFYRVIARTMFLRRNKEAKKSAPGLAFFLIIINCCTIMLIIEGVFKVNGFFTFAGKHSAPWGPMAGLFGALITMIGFRLFPRRYNRKTIGLIRRSFMKVTRKKAFGFLIITLVLTILSFATVIHRILTE
jgi:hypothetical protein